jgi:hypothetical protein
VEPIACPIPERKSAEKLKTITQNIKRAANKAMI